MLFNGKERMGRGREGEGRRGKGREGRTDIPALPPVTM
jgi:hypothetical protein